MCRSTLIQSRASFSGKIDISRKRRRGWGEFHTRACQTRRPAEDFARALVVKWQTRTFEGRMPKGVGVQVPPRARFALTRVRDGCGLERAIIGSIPSSFAPFLFNAGSIAARHENRHLPGGQNGAETAPYRGQTGRFFGRHFLMLSFMNFSCFTLTTK